MDETLHSVRERIAGACRRAGRSPADVCLVGASKTVPLERMAAAARAGLADFGENYADDLAWKSAAIAAAGLDVRWHFIGRLQSGTAARVADHADVVHSAEPGRALERLARRAQDRDRSLTCLIQVDMAGRGHGVTVEETEGFLDEVARLAGDSIHVTGLMTLPPPTPSAEAARPYFRALRELRGRLIATWPDLRDLSMGMSGDYEVAIEEGATMVRVGTALFGARPHRTAEGRGRAERVRNGRGRAGDR
jgi:pyridoxal phosphate enzyme (YggS family)